MKIAVYGDSFASMRLSNETSQPTWISMLVQDLGATHVDWYGRGGSSTYFSYQNIVNTADQYDRIVWAVTNPTRYPVAVPMAAHHLGWVPNDLLIDQADPDIRSDLLAWYRMSDTGFMETAQELMVQRVMDLMPTAILIPCFEHSLSPAQQRTTGWGNWFLSRFNQMFMRHYFNRSNLEPRKEQHNMVHHIPIDWHQAVADCVLHAITQDRPPFMPRLDQLPRLEHPLDTYLVL